ncbi:MAG: T9SS type A sorting domain-containing protein [Flavobacteriales bacterium]|nr:T9SS type A sorting domain-containing protein [Flavobacteriales bacterium]
MISLLSLFRTMMRSLRYLFLLVLSALTLGVSAQKKFAISPNGTITICKGDSVKVEAPSGYVRYAWSTGSTNRFIVVGSAGTYYAGAYDSAGHTHYDSLTVHVQTPIEPKITTNPKNGTICSGDSLIIEVNHGFTDYTWNTGDTGRRVVLHPSKSGYVILEAKDSNGCGARKVIQYAVTNCGNGQCDSLIEAWPDAHLCGDKDSVILEVRTGFKSYEWSDKKTGRARVVKDDGWYVVTVTDSSGKTCTDSIKITKSSKGITISTNPNPAVICKGDKVVIEISNDYDSIWWSTGAKHVNKITVDPKTTTNYVVEAIDPHGCEHRQEFKVTVKDSCSECDDLIGVEKKVICGDHDTAVLEAKSGYWHYAWSTKSTDRIIRVSEPGWYYVVAIKQDSTVCVDSVLVVQGGKEIAIGANPKNATVCSGDSMELEATYGFKRYTWSVDGKQHVNGIAFLPNESKKVWVEGVDEHGCSSKAYIYVTVVDCDSCPHIIEPWPSSNLCGRDSIILEAKNGYASYTWKGGKTGRVRTVKEAGWYWVEFTDSAGKECKDSVYISDESPKELKIKVYPSGEICVGDTVVISASEGFKSYAWNTGKQVRLYEYVAEKNKELVVEATDSNGCEKRVIYKLEVDSCNHSTSRPLTMEEVRLFPNPTSGMVFIQTTMQLNGITVYDMEGRLVLHQDQLYEHQPGIDATTWRDGVYLIMLTTEKGLVHRLIIKQ